MQKTTLLRMLFFILSGAIIFGFPTSCVKNDSVNKNKVTIQSGNNKLTIMKDANGQFTQTHECPSSDCWKGGEIKNLIIKYKQPNDSYAEADILTIPEHTEIKTDDPKTSNPGCTWYFWSKRYWYVCD